MNEQRKSAQHTQRDTRPIAGPVAPLAGDSMSRDVRAEHPFCEPRTPGSRGVGRCMRCSLPRSAHPMCAWCGDLAEIMGDDGEMYCREDVGAGGVTLEELTATPPVYNPRLALRAIREYVDEAQHGEDFPTDSLDALLDDLRVWVESYPAFARVELSMHRYDDGTGIAVEGIDYDGDEFAHEFCDAEFALMFDTLHRSNGFSYDEIAAAIPTHD